MPMPGMITLGADTLAAHPARIGINAGERLSDFALIVLALDSSRGEIKIVPGLMLAAFIVRLMGRPDATPGDGD